MAHLWNADPNASFKRRMGRPGPELGGGCYDSKTCPDIWELDNGDVAIIGRDLTGNYAGRLPTGVNVGRDERLVIIPGGMFRAARSDSPDA